MVSREILAAVLSAIVLFLFGGSLAIVLTQSAPPGSENVANVLLGALAGMAGTVVSYWVGSSSGSARKTELMAPPPTPTGDGDVPR